MAEQNQDRSKLLRLLHYNGGISWLQSLKIMRQHWVCSVTFRHLSNHLGPTDVKLWILSTNSALCSRLIVGRVKIQHFRGIREFSVIGDMYEVIFGLRGALYQKCLKSLVHLAKIRRFGHADGQNGSY